MRIKMMKKIKGNLIVPSLLACTLLSCNGGSSDKAKETSDSIPAAETKTEKKSNLFYALPSPIQLGLILQKAGATYNKNVLNPLSNLSTYSLPNSKALNLGVYGADLSYSAIFNQSQDTKLYLNGSKKLADELGITNSFSAEMMKRMEKNEGNKDSLLQIISELFLGANESLKENKQADISILVLAGGFVEGMYIGTQTAKNVKDNTAIYKRIAELRGPLSNLILMMEKLNNPDYASIIEDLKSIKTIYGDAPAASAKVTATADTTKKTLTIGGGKAGAVLSTDQIEKITTQVTAIRAKIIKP